MTRENKSGFKVAMEDSNPLVSVVIATYFKDDPVRLKNSLESILIQTYRPIELILVADGHLSSESEKIISDFHLSSASSTPPISVITLNLPQNRGPAAARNWGIKHANGHYLAIQDADDVAVRDRIEKQFAYLTKSKVDIVSSDYFEVEKDGSLRGIRKLPSRHESIRKLAPFFNPICNPSVFCKTAIFKAHPYPENLRVGEDFRLWIKLILLGVKFANTGEPLIYFYAPEDFSSRRQGANWAKSEFATRLMASRIYPIICRPLIFAFALFAFIVRLLPPYWIENLYKLRRKFSFSS